MAAIAPSPTASSRSPWHLAHGAPDRPATWHGRHPHMAATLLAADTRMLSDVAAAGAIPTRWRQPGFARRVDAIRHQLEPLVAADLVIASFEREALHHRPQARVPGAVRVAYAVRLLECETDGNLPGWAGWVQACARRP